MSPGCVWHSFELGEEDYWNAVARLQQFTPEDLKGRHRDPWISSEIQPDYGAPETDNYQVWIQPWFKEVICPEVHSRM